MKGLVVLSMMLAAWALCRSALPATHSPRLGPCGRVSCATAVPWAGRAAAAADARTASPSPGRSATQRAVSRIANALVVFAVAAIIVLFIVYLAQSALQSRA